MRWVTNGVKLSSLNDTPLVGKYKGIDIWFRFDGSSSIEKQMSNFKRLGSFFMIGECEVKQLYSSDGELMIVGDPVIAEEVFSGMGNVSLGFKFTKCVYMVEILGQRKDSMRTSKVVIGYYMRAEDNGKTSHKMTQNKLQAFLFGDIRPALEVCQVLKRNGHDALVIDEVMDVTKEIRQLNYDMEYEKTFEGAPKERKMRKLKEQSDKIVK